MLLPAIHHVPEDEASEDGAEQKDDEHIRQVEGHEFALDGGRAFRPVSYHLLAHDFFIAYFINDDVYFVFNENANGVDGKRCNVSHVGNEGESAQDLDLLSE